ncbi:MAG: arsenate reductase family protein [Leptospiraceae bacterium]|nr:arsenate reductase family protein [Leptospiraceae bacterium]
MTIQIFGTKKCKDTQKAIRFFQERRVSIHQVNLLEKPISKGELENILRVIPIEDLMDKEGKEYKKQNLQYVKFNIAEKLLENSMLLKTPIARNGKNVTVGYKPDVWTDWLKS